MDNISEPPQRSGGIDFDQSDVRAEDLVGRDKFEFNLPEIPRKGCYAQLSKNIKFVVSLGVLLLLIYAVFRQLNQPSVSEQTPTPTAVETATPTGTPVPVTTPTVEAQQPLPGTPTPEPPFGRATSVVRPETRTPVVVTATLTPTMTASPTRRPVVVTVTPGTIGPSTPVVRPPTPTPRPTPTPVPTTAVPSPRPLPTATPRPPTPTPNPCPSAAVRLGPVASLVTEGDIFTASVLISCAVNLAGYQIELRFDPAVVVVQGVDNGGFLGSAGGSVFAPDPGMDNSAGTATASAVVLRPGPYPTGSGTLASFRLKAAGPGSSDLHVGVSLSDVNGESMPASVTDGAVVVQPRATAVPSAP